jgi:hypothetical protein
MSPQERWIASSQVLLAMTKKMAGIAPGHFHIVLTNLTAAARCRAGAAEARPARRSTAA